MALLSLPPELHHVIVSLAASTPGLPEEALRTRLAVLRALCLVCKALYPIATSALYDLVHLPDERAAELFVRTVGSDGWALRRETDKGGTRTRAVKLGRVDVRQQGEKAGIELTRRVGVRVGSKLQSGLWVGEVLLEFREGEVDELAEVRLELERSAFASVAEGEP